MLLDRSDGREGDPSRDSTFASSFDLFVVSAEPFELSNWSTSSVTLLPFAPSLLGPSLSILVACCALSVDEETGSFAGSDAIDSDDTKIRVLE